MGTPKLLTEHLRARDEALGSGRYVQAVAAYVHAQQLAPQDPRVQRGLMRARVHLMADRPGRITDDALEDVAYDAELLLRLDPPNRVVYLAAQGNVVARRGNYDAAKSKLTEAVGADATSSIAHAALGALLMRRSEDFVAARVEFERALELRPNGFVALAGLGYILLVERDLAGAVTRLQAALLESEDFAARVSLGNAFLQQDKHAEAAEQFRRATELDPTSAEAWSLLGQAHLGAGRIDDAAAALRSSLQRRADASTSVALGYALQRPKKSVEALGVFNDVLARDGGSASALYGAALASEDLGQTDQALDFYRRLVALPVDGPQKDLVAELRQEAQKRVGALAPATGEDKR
jgi:protein O-GlcNAc transferase